MNIYDKAIKELQEVIGEYGMDYYNDKHFPITIKALERAKKEHELLELYRKHMNTLCKNAREGVKDSLFSAEYVAYELYQQIKTLEEELK